MRKVIVFYSYTGSTRKLAEAKAKEEQADLLEVGTDIRPSRLKAYSVECFRALGKKEARIENITDKLEPYHEIIVMGPVWAGYPAPAVNGILAALPPSKEVSVYMVSASGAQILVPV